MWGKIKNSLAANLLLSFIAILVFYGVFNILREMAAVFKESGDTRRKIEELTKKKNDLEAYIAELETPEAIEREAKERLNLKLKGEEVVVVPEEKRVPTAEPDPLWMKIKKSLLGIIP